MGLETLLSERLRSSETRWPLGKQEVETAIYDVEQLTQAITEILASKLMDLDKGAKDEQQRSVLGDSPPFAEATSDPHAAQHNVKDFAQTCEDLGWGSSTGGKIDGFSLDRGVQVGQGRQQVSLPSSAPPPVLDMGLSDAQSVDGDHYSSEYPAAVQSDSGYESMKSDQNGRLTSLLLGNGLTISQSGNENEYVPILNHQTSDDDFDDSTTTYSESLSIPADDLDTYKSELSDRLFQDISKINPTFDSLDTLNDALPPLLRSFALRLGSADSTKTEREVMMFVHKHREDITATFKDVVKDKDNQESSFQCSDKTKTTGGIDIEKWLDGLKTELNDDKSTTHHPVSSQDYIEEQPSLLDIRGYREAALTSVAYRWLLASLVTKLTMGLVNEGLDVSSLLHHKLLNHFEKSRSVSKREPAKRYFMTFVADWNPTAFLSQQFPNNPDTGRLLDETLTITGSSTDAQILPCSEYLKQTWPTTGPTLLALLRAALKSNDDVSGELEDKSFIKCQFSNSALEIAVEGITDSIAIIGEQIGWLGAALRSSCFESGLATCYPDFQFSSPGTATARCFIRYPLVPLAFRSTDNAAGQCWHGIFHNPIVVAGYPIPKRRQYATGLEIPLNVMAGLSYSTALVPTGRMNDMILWHLYYSDNGSRLPYPDPQGLDRAAEMDYDIKASKLERPGKEFALEKITFSVGQFVTGGCQFAIGRKDCHIQITQGSFINKLKWLDKKFVTLWDVEDERGWLINGNAALLHLLRSYLQDSLTDKFKSEFHFQPTSFQESRNPHSADSVLEVLLNEANQKLELYDNDISIHNGQPIASRTTIKDRIDELYETLEKLIDFQATSESSSKGLNAKPYFQDYLHGWDFMDIATNRSPFFLRKATFGLSMLGWPDMTRSISAITLFGKGFGDLIQATDTPAHGACRITPEQLSAGEQRYVGATQHYQFFLAILVHSSFIQNEFAWIEYL
ncbi:pfs domain [Fusarium sporotrichioides]|uniref:Pfs domain n=1 Tax=Fusarium sporotrichioides TaxID=5514 RepID=A0A395SH76_FUSSP|nr:pfs domain [Fusarium sporotrichioides]